MPRTTHTDADTIDQDATIWDGLTAMFGRESFFSTKAKILAAGLLVAGFVVVPLVKELVVWALIGAGLPVWVVVGITALYTIHRSGVLQTED